MISVLIGFFDSQTLEEISPTLKVHSLIVPTYAYSVAEWQEKVSQRHFDLFFVHFMPNCPTTQNIISELRELPEHKHTPIYIFCSRIELLVSSYINWRCCECFLLPLSDESRKHLSELLHHLGSLYFKMRPSESRYCQVETTKGIHVVPLTQILFAESTMKKSILHLKNEELHLPHPLYQMRSILPAENFVQTHRSFIVNVSNISFIDKTNEPWGIFFFDSNKEAYVSRSHQKELLPYFHTLQSTVQSIERTHT